MRSPPREIVLVGFVYFVAESFYTIYTFYTAKINSCVAVYDYCSGEDVV